MYLHNTRIFCQETRLLISVTFSGTILCNPYRFGSEPNCSLTRSMLPRCVVCYGARPLFKGFESVRRVELATTSNIHLGYRQYRAVLRRTHTMSKGEDKRPLILATLHPHIKTQEEIFNKSFRLILWNDFLADTEACRHDIKGIMYIPAYKPKMTEEFLRSMPNLKVLSTTSTGTNHLDLPLLNRCGVKVGHARGILDDTCADFIFGLLIAAARKIPQCIEMARGYEDTTKGWTRTNVPTGVKVTGATMGILGMGCIGYEVARRASGFKMRVLYHNRTRRKPEEEAEVKATYCRSVDEMLPEVDFLVISASLNDDSKNLIGKKQLELMKSSAIIVNGGRGLILDQDALVEALRSGAIRGAALDATFPEPLHKDHTLLHMPNVIVTAHLSSFVGETLDAVMENCVANLQAGIDGRPLPTEVQRYC